MYEYETSGKWLLSVPLSFKKNAHERLFCVSSFSVLSFSGETPATGYDNSVAPASHSEQLLQQRKEEAKTRRRKKKKTNSSLVATTFQVRLQKLMPGSFKILKHALPAQELYRFTGEMLGQGAYACVQTCRNVWTDLEYAVKVIEKVPGHSRSRVFKEIEMFHHCRGHKNIIQLVEYFEEPDRFYLVFEKINGGGCY